MDNKLVTELEFKLRKIHQFFDITKKYHDGGEGLRSVELLIKIKNDEEVTKLLKVLK